MSPWSQKPEWHIGSIPGGDCTGLVPCFSLPGDRDSPTSKPEIQRVSCTLWHEFRLVNLLHWKINSFLRNAGDIIHRVNPDQQWRVHSQEQTQRRESDTLESLEKTLIWELCTSPFDLTFTCFSEGVNQKKGPKYENRSTGLKWAVKYSFYGDVCT